MVKAEIECQHTAHMSSHGNFLLRQSVAQKCCSSQDTLFAEHETSNALVGIWSEERSTPCVTERDSAQTERVLTRLAVHSPSP